MEGMLKQMGRGIAILLLLLPSLPFPTDIPMGGKLHNEHTYD